MVALVAFLEEKLTWHPGEIWQMLNLQIDISADARFEMYGDPLITLAFPIL